MHPAIYVALLLFVIPLFTVAKTALLYTLNDIGIGYPYDYLIVIAIFYISIVTSVINIRVIEKKSGVFSLVVERGYVYFLGIPIPVISSKLVENKVIIAVNVGGALIPVIVSLVISSYIVSKGLLSFQEILIPVIITALTTFIVSKPIPRVGIATPAFIPPSIAMLSSIFFIGLKPIAPIVAYISGSIGSLVGADILRLSIEYKSFVNKYGPSILSIGGAGTFDGIYLSGILALLFTTIITRI